ncbi:MAG: hypothetical protein PHE89_00275 [Alphaproteobacteria bacterium]|nr:hypothetical protein [Alphaproteobacteria bacterium]
MEKTFGCSTDINCKHKTFHWKVNVDTAATQLSIDKSRLMAGRKRIPSLGNQLCDVWFSGRDCVLADGRGKFSL